MSTVLITGASSGIGLEFARIFARNNHDLVIVALEQNLLEDLAREVKAKHGVLVEVVAADLRKMSEVQRVYDHCKQKNITIEYLINDAGIGTFGPFVDTDLDCTESVIDLNIKALTRLCRLFIPDMIHRCSGHVLNVASTAAFQPGPLMAVYYASKAYVLSFSEALFEELKLTAVHVTCLCPGPTQTSFFSTARMEDSNLVRGKTLPTAAEVAQFGYRALIHKDMTAVHGLKNRFFVLVVRMLPRSWVLPLALKHQARISASNMR